MSIVVFLESRDNKLDPSAYEVAGYAAQLAEKANKELIGVILGKAENIDAIAKYGMTRVVTDENPAYLQFDAHLFAKALHLAMQKYHAEYCILSHTYNGKAIAPYLSVWNKAALITSAIDLPEINGSAITIKRNVFAGKATATVQCATPIKIIAILPNSFGKKTKEVTLSVEPISLEISESDRKTKVKEIKKVSDKVSLTEAEIVVSGGRGLKGPENWKMVEELAEIMGAATACSRPVADAHWRPHHEHVGQTGTAIRPNLYIAIGISGAIQHLAGVNGSKVIVVINTDPEAPFFKAADYGIIGDAFQVVPKLIESYKEWKKQHA